MGLAVRRVQQRIDRELNLLHRARDPAAGPTDEPAGLASAKPGQRPAP
jgi:hypothetical protein